MPEPNPILHYVYDRITHLCGEIGAHIAETIDDPDIIAGIPFAMFMLENSLRQWLEGSILINPNYFPDLRIQPVEPNVSTILAELAARYGNEWPRYVIAELGNLAFQMAVEDTAKIDLNVHARERYGLLYSWILETISAGIVAQQTTAAIIRRPLPPLTPDPLTP